ncbi:hypothetical protein HU200_067375 [Digitaria exilis]|uniref:HMA domain-containing protein n=1 Tax=Digitaria exilis TaxID=1010633 RepID=A0A835A0C2_9POAL|nr:hypothetical protein HU200_067375 [Digitaria exilis]CAB3479469.1 unnamed protein product [Digitaria exilis]
MAPVVVLRMDMHCVRCARRIRKFVKSLSGVQDLWVSPDTGMMVVSGSGLDASLLKWWIQSKTGRLVDVVNDGAAEEFPPETGQMVHLGPTPAYSSYSYPYPYAGYGGGGGWVPSQHAFPYMAAGDVRRQYMPNEAPVCFNDDNPNGCCTMQ